MLTKQVYVAASFAEIVKARALALQLAEHGIGCTASWLSEDEDSLLVTTPDTLKRELAMQDLRDIEACDALVLIAPGSARGGCHVETGYALGLGKPVVIYGARTNVFHYLPQTWQADTFPGLVQALKGD